MLVDTHCHIHAHEFYPDNREEVYARATEAGMKLICVGTDQADSFQAVDFAASHEQAFAVVGVHPHEAKHGYSDIAQIVKQKPAKLVGIGEIGLDYFYNHSEKSDQLKAFEDQLQIASDHNLPVSFHVRDAFDDFWPIFDSFSGIRGVLHSFTDDQASLERGLNRGLLIGLNGISTFTKDEKQRQMYDSIPLQSIVLETDAPFLTPAPLRGKVNEPTYVKYVAEYHAQRRGISLGQFTEVTASNAHQLFAI